MWRSRLQCGVVAIALGLWLLVYMHVSTDGNRWWSRLHQAGSRNRTTPMPVVVRNYSSFLNFNPKSAMTRQTFTRPHAEICESRPFVVVYVVSAPKNRDRRDAIRKTHGSATTIFGKEVRVVFLVGHGENKTEICREDDLFGDIVLADVEDLHYEEIYVKDFVGVQWTAEVCTTAGYFVRTDDDVVIDIFQLTQKLLKESTSGVLKGLKISAGSPVLRKGKYAVRREDFSPDAYPQYCIGIGVVFTPDVAQKLLKVAFATGVISVGDALMSGIYAHNAGLVCGQMDIGYWEASTDCVSVLKSYPSVVICATRFHRGLNPTIAEYFNSWEVILSRHAQAGWNDSAAVPPSFRPQNKGDLMVNE